MNIEVFTLGFDNGDGSCSIRCFSSEEERDSFIKNNAEKRGLSEEEIDENLTGMELGYPDSATIEFDKNMNFKSFSVYMEP